MTALEFQTQLTNQIPYLEWYTKKFTKDENDSKDLIQETLFKALKYKDKFKKNTNLKGWLYTIMRNTFINQYRRSGRIYDPTTSDVNLPLEQKISETFTTPDAAYREKELWNIIDALKPGLKFPFVMYQQGYKYHEISEKLDIPIGTVKNRIFQARKEIKSKIELA